jgi:hypothetical protein
MLQVVAEKGSISLGDLGDKGEQLIKTMNDKINKYVGSRASTPMFGLAMFFVMTGHQYIGPIIAGLRAMDTLDAVFGLTERFGKERIDQLVHASLSPGQKLSVFSLPIEHPLSFVLHVTEKVDGPRVVLFVNNSVASSSHAFFGHPVIRWLRELEHNMPPGDPNA